VDKPVAIKVYPENHALFTGDMTGARAASETGMVPQFDGELPAGPGRRSFAMEKFERSFVEYMGTEALTPAEQAAGKAQAQAARAAVTETTVNDIRAYESAIVKQGSYYDGEVQGLITKDGRWRPIDFQ